MDAGQLVRRDRSGRGMSRSRSPNRRYDLRHTYATLMLLAGVNPKVVSERLGRASVVITLDTYWDVLPANDRIHRNRVALRCRADVPWLRLRHATEASNGSRRRCPHGETQDSRY